MHRKIPQMMISSYRHFRITAGSLTQRPEAAEEQKVMELVEQYISNTLHEYKTKPMYYLKIKKSECHIIVRINDIPVYEDFSDYDCNYDDYDVHYILSIAVCHAAENKHLA